jgi:hypothetical protein
VTVISGAATRGGRLVELDVDVGLEEDIVELEGFLVVLDRAIELDVDIGLELEAELDEEGFRVVVDRVVGLELSLLLEDEREGDADTDVELLVGEPDCGFDVDPVDDDDTPDTVPVISGSVNGAYPLKEYVPIFPITGALVGIRHAPPTNVLVVDAVTLHPETI